MTIDTSNSSVTQVKHPWRATLRTVAAALVSFAIIFPSIVNGLNLPEWSGISAAVAASGALTRLLAHPYVEAALQTYVPWLAAAAKNAEERVAGQ